MNPFLAAFLGCLVAIIVVAQAFTLYQRAMMWRFRRRGPNVGAPYVSLEYPKIDPEDLKTIMIGEMLDNHQIALRKACGCKLCTPFVNLTMPSPSIAEPRS